MVLENCLILLLDSSDGEKRMWGNFAVSNNVVIVRENSLLLFTSFPLLPFFPAGYPAIKYSEYIQELNF